MARRDDELDSPQDVGDIGANREQDADLMRRVAADDQKAIAELYDRFVPLVYRMSLQILPSKTDAEDAVQEVFVRLWRTADRYDAQRAALVTWVMLITRRHIVDRLRRTRSRISTVSMDESQKSSGIVSRIRSRWRRMNASRIS